MKKSLGDSDEKKVIRLYKEGLSTVQIMQRFGISKGVIYRILNENGVKMDRRNVWMEGA